jgi:hypothetical protein
VGAAIAAHIHRQAIAENVLSIPRSISIFLLSGLGEDFMGVQMTYRMLDPRRVNGRILLIFNGKENVRFRCFTGRGATQLSQRGRGVFDSRGYVMP